MIKSNQVFLISIMIFMNMVSISVGFGCCGNNAPAKYTPNGYRPIKRNYVPSMVYFASGNKKGELKYNAPPPVNPRPIAKPREERVVHINDLIMKGLEPTTNGLNCYLNGKNINSLETAEFPKGIKILSLMNNNIQSLQNVKFPESLEELHLDENNINQPFDLSSMHNLKILSLNNNEIRSLQNMHLPPNLQLLSLNGNKFESITDIYDLRYLSKLQHLFLTKNQIWSMNYDLRLILPASIEQLALDENGMSSIKIKVHETLENLDLRNNPLEKVIIINEDDCPKLNLLIDNTKSLDEKVSDSQIDRLPKLIWNLEKEKQCDICCMQFQKGDVVKTLPCLHQFHCQCIDQWLKKHELCPECRHNINDVGDDIVENEASYSDDAV